MGNFWNEHKLITSHGRELPEEFEFFQLLRHRGRPLWVSLAAMRTLLTLIPPEWTAMLNDGRHISFAWKNPCRWKSYWHFYSSQPSNYSCNYFSSYDSKIWLKLLWDLFRMMKVEKFYHSTLHFALKLMGFVEWMLGDEELLMMRWGASWEIFKSQRVDKFTTRKYANFYFREKKYYKLICILWIFSFHFHQTNFFFCKVYLDFHEIHIFKSSLLVNEFFRT